MEKKVLFTQFPVTSHTDFVSPGGTFVAIQGLKEDGTRYILKAIQQGAKTVVVQEGVALTAEVQKAVEDNQVFVERVADTRKSLALLSAQAAGNPAEKLSIFAVTGTKGKTTTCWMLGHLLAALGKKVAFITTAGFFLTVDGVHNELAGFELQEHLTTPQADFLHQFLKLCVEKGVEYVVLEVAVQALTFQRVHGITFDGIIFTNLDREHGEFYPSMDQYFLEKAKILEHAKPNAPLLVNGQDLYGQRLLATYPCTYSFGMKNSDLLSDGTEKISDYVGSIVDDQFLSEQKVLVEDVKNGQALSISYKWLPGKHNCMNFLAAASLLRAKGFDLAPLENTTLLMDHVPGRMEFYQLPQDVLCCIDYAHTAASMEVVLKTMREFTRHLVVVFGAGGGKDSFKRPLMGKVAGKYADQVIITSDNPRDEDPEKIARQIMAGIKPKHRQKVLVELDRERAVARAFGESTAGSAIMLLGKGADQGQTIKGVMHPYSDFHSINMLWYFHKLAAGKNLEDESSFEKDETAQISAVVPSASTEISEKN